VTVEEFRWLSLDFMSKPTDQSDQSDPSDQSDQSDPSDPSDPSDQTDQSDPSYFVWSGASAVGFWPA